jgi:hypothetical protein
MGKQGAASSNHFPDGKEGNLFSDQFPRWERGNCFFQPFSKMGEKELLGQPFSSMGENELPLLHIHVLKGVLKKKMLLPALLLFRPFPRWKRRNSLFWAFSKMGGKKMSLPTIYQYGREKSTSSNSFVVWEGRICLFQPFSKMRGMKLPLPTIF